MVIIGATTSARRVPEVPGLFWLSAAALGLAVAVSLAVVFGLAMLPLVPRTVVPAAGMLLGNAIASSILVARRTVTEISTHHDRIETRLALGQPAVAALRPQVRDALRTAITPQIETTKIVGIIALPGTMVGLLLAGVEPADAVMLQIAVMLLILGSVAITTVVVGTGAAHRFITDDERVVVGNPSGIPPGRGTTARSSG
jgi:putative ABC transport system permease protein